MSLRDYEVARDKFTLDARNGGPPRFAHEVAFPCCVCVHAEHTDRDEPCRTCDHNVNAVKDTANSVVDATSQTAQSLPPPTAE